MDGQGANIIKIIDPFSQMPPIAGIGANYPFLPNYNSDFEKVSQMLELLSMQQIHELLRENSLPISGSKKDAIKKLVMYLQTFSIAQPNILFNFTNRLKDLLSTKSYENAMSTKIDSSDSSILLQIPSIIYELTDVPPLLGPLLIDVDKPFPSFLIKKPNDSILIPVVKFFPEDPNSFPINSISFKVDDKIIMLRSPFLWMTLQDFLSTNSTFQIVSIEPLNKIKVVIQLLKRVPIEEVVKKISEKEPAPLINSNELVDGVCPLSKKICITPARGINCLHPQCFDLSYYLNYCYESNNWVCPICYKILYPEDIRIDTEYYKRVKVI